MQVKRYHYDSSSFQHADFGAHDPAKLLELYRSMLRIRRIEEQVEGKYHEDQMKTPIHLVIGQEGTYVGACSALTHSDLVYASHRTHGVYLAKGGDLKAMFAEFFCRTTGCCGSRGGSMHLLDQSVGMAGSSAICGGNVPIAVGMALTAQLKNHKHISVCFFGDGAAEEGVVWESINFAALKKLPVVFVCENNFYSVFTPLEKRQPEGTKLYKKAEAFGAHAEHIDGTRVLDMYEAMDRAKTRALEGMGPTFIEAPVYRWRGHGGSGDDNHKGYRDPADLEEWKKVCPLTGFGNELRKREILTDAIDEQYEKEISEEIQEAFEFAASSPEPGENELGTFVYSEYKQAGV